MAKIKRKPRQFVSIDGCPCPIDVAPYVYLVLRRAGQTASSIYRGDNAEAAAILHRHGKMTQREIHNSPKYRAISNPPGKSQHDLHDGNGRAIPTWQVGIDSGGDDAASKARIERAARHYGLVAYHPYSRGVEGHHWAFAKQPRADGKHLTKTRVSITRARLRLNR